MAEQDTIYALATAHGRAGVAIIRISGPHAYAAGKVLAGELPTYKASAIRTISFEGVVLDQALVLVFEQGASFTGEAIVELHLHGSIAVVNSVLAALSHQEGLRLAQAGEFTRRALEHGVLDLAQVEGLADLIEAETKAQQVLAIKVMKGALSKKTANWRSGLLRAMSLVEATIDFSEEELPDTILDEVIEYIKIITVDIQAELSGRRASERIRDGFEVALVGLPNVGKSTLLNFLAGREAALTSPIAGTTRDIIEVRLDIAGVPVTFLDTAGIRNSDDEIEKMGVDRTIDRARAADIRVFINSTDENHGIEDIKKQEGDISVIGKGDLLPGRAGSVSGLSGKGVDQLLYQIEKELTARVSGASLLIRDRQQEALKKAVINLDTSLELLQADLYEIEIVADNLRNAVLELDILVGKVDVEDILGEIFSSFCIGK